MWHGVRYIEVQEGHLFLPDRLFLVIETLILEGAFFVKQLF